MNLVYTGTLPPHPGGSAIACSRMLGGLAELGHDIRAVAPITATASAAGDPFEREWPEVAVRRFLVPHFQPRSPVFTDDYRRLERMESLRLVKSAIAEQRPDVVIVGRESFAWDIPTLAARERVPCLVIVHGGTTFGLLDRGDPAPAARRLLRQMRSASRIVAPAQHLIRRLRQLELTNVSHVPNAVDLEAFRPAPRDDALARSLGIDASDVVVVHLSNLGDVKRPLDLVDSAAAALQRCPELVYVVVGDGRNRRAMEERCAEKGIAGRFRFTGWLDYAFVPDFVRLADVVVVASSAEGQALVYLEAQACGRALIASDIAAAREVVVDGRTGLLFPMGDPAELAEKTVRAAQDPGLRHRLGREARQRVKRHSHRKAIRAYDTLLSGLVPVPVPAR